MPRKDSSSLGESCCCHPCHARRKRSEGGSARPGQKNAFREDGSHKKVGVGIQGMHERVKQFCGGFEIRSDKNGTTLLATVPVPSSSAQTSKPVILLDGLP